VHPKAKLIGDRIEVCCHIEGTPTKISWDTGAQVSLTSEAWLTEHLAPDKYTIHSADELIRQGLSLKAAGDGDIAYSGYTELSVRLGKSEDAREVIVPFLVTQTKYSIPILGSNTMDVLLEGENAEAKLECLASFGLEEPEVLMLTGMLHRWMEDAVVASVTVAEDEVIPARTARVINCRIDTTVGEEMPVLFQPSTEWEEANETLALYAAVLNLKKGRNENIRIKIKNKDDRDFYFRSGELLGSLEEVDTIEDSGIEYRELQGEESCAAKVENITTQPNLVKTSPPASHKVSDPHIGTQSGEPQAPSKLLVDLEDSDIQEASRPFYDQVMGMEFPELTEEEVATVKQMLWEEREAFSQNKDDIGSVPELKLKLNLVDNIPVQRNYNAIPKPMYAEVRAQIQTMLDRGWIRKSESAWSSPIVLVKKKTGGMRMCCDFRLLNKKTVPDKHPIPRIAEAIDSLQGSSWFSVLDLSRAYYQGYLDEDSRPMTAFVTPFGFYEWNRIPFGLSNAVPTFQRFMEKMLEDVRDEFALPYLDDTIVHGSSVLEHVEQIRHVLQKFRHKGLKLNPSKCDLFKREVCYLGRIVSHRGHRMDEKSVEAVRDLANKKFENVGSIRQLMGLLNYHRRHVQNFAEIALPLNELLADHDPVDERAKTSTSKSQKKGVPSKRRIQWKPEHQAALEKLIGFITNPPILAYADFNSEFFLHTDASGAGLGAILYQEQQGEVRVIAYASRSLKPAERNYHSTKLEFMAMKWAICDAFRDYLAYSDHFRCYTDNNPLLFVMSLTKPNSTIQRWVSELGEFNFSVFYRPGVINRDADSLSRLPLDIESYIPLCEEEISLDRFQMMVGRIHQAPEQSPSDQATPVTIGPTADHLCTDSHPVRPTDPEREPGQQHTVQAVRTSIAPPRFTFATSVENVGTITDLKRDQEEDEYIGPMISRLKGGQLPASTPETTPNTHRLLLQKERSKLYFDEDEILRRKAQGGYQQIVLPLKHRDMVFKALHVDMGHLGSERVMQLARQRVYWPKMQTDIEEYTQQRCRCKAQRRIHREAVAPLVSIHSSMPMELLAIDFVHLEKSSSGYEYILVLIDHFTRYAQGYATKNKSSVTAAKNIFNDFVLRFGLPARILHDQGREFENKLFKELERFCGVVRSRTTPYHPQGNGKTERMNSTLLQMLRTLSESEKPNWHLHINKLMAAYNATTHSSTGYSPHYLLFGREPLLPIDVILSRRLTNAQERAHSYNNFVMEWEARMTEAYEIASKNVKKVQNYSEERWKKRLIASTLQPGDKVLVKNKREQGGPGKLRAYWEQDIYVVTKVNPDGVVYEVQKPQGGEKRMLHRNMLLSCDMIELDDDTTRTQDSQPPSQSPSVASATRSRVSRKRPVASQPAADHDSSSTDSDGTDSENEEFEAYQPTSTHKNQQRPQLHRKRRQQT